MKPLVTITIEDERLDDLASLGEADILATYKEMIDNGLVDLSADMRSGKVKLVSLKASRSSTPDSTILQWPSPITKVARTAEAMVAAGVVGMATMSLTLDLANYFSVIDLFTS